MLRNKSPYRNHLPPPIELDYEEWRTLMFSWYIPIHYREKWDACYIRIFYTDEFLSRLLKVNQSDNRLFRDRGFTYQVFFDPKCTPERLQASKTVGISFRRALDSESKTWYAIIRTWEKPVESLKSGANHAK